MPTQTEMVVAVPRVRIVVNHWRPGPDRLSGFGSMSITADTAITVAEAARRYWRRDLKPKTWDILA
jgi:hypothetical protein